MARNFSDAEIAAMDLATAETEISNAVYEATSLLERLEHAGKVRGNGHHARQAVALYSTQEMRTRWTNEAEAKKRAEDQTMQAADLSAQR